MAQGLHRSYNDCINPLNAELNPVCHLLALLGGATIVVVSRLRVKEEDTNYKMQRPSHNPPYFTYSKDNSKDT